MKAFRPAATALALLAVLTNTAMATPCHCARPIEQKEECCSVSATHACCATKHIATHFQSKGCCCVESTPTSPFPRENQLSRQASQVLATATWVNLTSTLPPDGTRFSLPLSDRACLVGPPFLAMHCIWLN